MAHFISSASPGSCPSARSAAKQLAKMPGCESISVPSRSSSTERAGDMLEHSGRQRTSKRLLISASALGLGRAKTRKRRPRPASITVQRSSAKLAGGWLQGLYNMPLGCCPAHDRHGPTRCDAIERTAVCTSRGGWLQPRRALPLANVRSHKSSAEAIAQGPISVLAVA